MNTERGKTLPFGATPLKEGVNFAIHGKEIENMTLWLYRENQLFEKIPLDPEKNRSGSIWHILVKDLPETFGYAFEASRKEQKPLLLLDPYAKGVISDPKWRDSPREQFVYQPLGRYFPDLFDWGDDAPPNIAKQDMVIYEMHVRGFTNHPSSKVSSPGTFKGIIEKIPYLLELGVNAVELMPIQEFCEEDVIHAHPLTKNKHHNYFGYSTVNFFSPMNRYASQDAVHELKELIKELHKNKIEVILDFVLNHTGEGNEKGPILSFKGLDPFSYYIINAEGKYMNFSGCGNTFNCNDPITREFILDVLRYWVVEYHVDGFRFDLAAVFNRGKDGTPMEYGSIVDAISFDPVLSSKKLIAEPWDAGGLYQLGSFAPYEPRWSEWNGKYQNHVRHFIKGSSQYKSLFADMLMGSKSIFPLSSLSSINYISIHDGFSLADVVSYNEKHNEENGEDNLDGVSHTDTWNSGVEGETKDEKILQLRKQQMKNLHLALMLSQGIPMLFMGDEYGHTKKGNNNSWCQDNEINWFLWDKLEQNPDFFRFYKGLIHFRKNSPLLKKVSEVKWHGLRLNEPLFDEDNKLLAFTLHLETGNPGLYAAFNASDKEQTFEIPEGEWKWVVNTGNLPPKDFYENGEKVGEKTVKLLPYSSVLLEPVHF